jgi:hypothetical protein
MGDHQISAVDPFAAAGHLFQSNRAADDDNRDRNYL